MNRKTIALAAGGVVLLIAAGAAAWTILGGRDKALPVRTAVVEREEQMVLHMAASGSIHLTAAGDNAATSASQGVVTLTIDQSDITKLTKGQEARISIQQFESLTLAGRVGKIGQMALPGNSSDGRDFKVEVAVDRVPPEVREGMNCTTEIVLAKKENVLAVPLTAIVRRHGAGSSKADAKNQGKTGEKEVQGVFIMGADRLAHFRAVTLGLMGDMKVEVIDGLNEGDEVITGPLAALRQIEEQTPVRPEVEAKAKAEEKK